MMRRFGSSSRILFCAFILVGSSQALEFGRNAFDEEEHARILEEEVQL